MAEPAVRGVDAPLLNVATVAGRIDGSRMSDGVTYTKMTLPAADEYSSPQRIEIRSKRSLGRQGETVQVGVRIGGWVRKFDRKPDRDGVVDKGEDIRITLHAIED